MGKSTPEQTTQPKKATHAQREAGADQKLVERIRSGDEAAFRELYRKYFGRVYSYSLKRLRDVQEAEDATQEVFLRVYRSLGGFEGRSGLLSWIYGIASHVVCDRFRRRMPSQVSLDEPEAVQLSSGWGSQEATVDAGRLLDRCGDLLECDITPDARALFHLRFRENLPVRGIAKQTKKTDQAVKISLFRTRRALVQRVSGLAEMLGS